MSGIQAFKQIAAQHPDTARVRMDGAGAAQAHGKVKGALVQAFTKNTKLETQNRAAITTFANALRNAYGMGAGNTAFQNHLNARLNNGAPLRGRDIRAAITTAEAEVRYNINQHCANGQTRDVSALLQRWNEAEPQGVAQFMRSKFGDAATTNVAFTQYFVSCPDDPLSLGAAGQLAKLDAPTLSALDLTTLRTTIRDAGRAGEHISERFRQIPGLKLSNGVWSAAPGSNLGVLSGKLNDLQHQLLSAKLGAPINTAVGQLAAQLHLDVPTQNKLMNKLQDKLLTGDVLNNPGGVSLANEINAGNLDSLYQVAAEFLPAAQLDALVGGMNYDQTVRLVASAFAGRTVAYADYKEGSVNLMTALERRPATPLEIRQLIGNLRSGYFDAAAFRTAVTGQANINQAQLANITAARTTDANLAATALKTDYDTKRARALQIVNHFLGMLPPGGAMTDVEFRAKTGLTPTQARDLVPLLGNAPSQALVQRFVQTFGATVQLPNLNNPAAALANPGFQPEKSSLQAVAQLAWQFDALGAHGQKYLDGLNKMAMALPTAGKDLSNLTFLKTMAESLRKVVDDSGVVAANVRDYPLLVFDQSSGQRLIDNKTYIDQLALDTGARIERISMADVNAIAAKLGIQGMFDTTGTGRAGFGGARNIANMLGAVFDKAIKDQPTRTVADVVNLPVGQLKQLVKDAALTNDRMILMGDDDASVHPGFLHSKALIAYEQDGEHATAKTELIGRNSTQGGVPNDPTGFLNAGGVDGLKMVFLGSVTWANLDMKPVMAGALSHPGACLNLPTPTEESHVATYEGFTDILSKGLHHATDRYDDLGPKIKQYLSYTQQASLTDALLDCGQNYSQSAVLPWNHAAGPVMQKPDRSLKDVFTLAGQAATKTAMQQAFFDNLAAFTNKPAIGPLLTMNYDTIFATALGAPGLTPTAQRELTDARESYKAVQRDMQTAVDFRNRLFAKLNTEFANTPVANRDAAWNAANTGSDAAKAKWLVTQGHNIGQRVADVAADMAAPPTAVTVNSADQNPLTQIVYLSAKSIGAGEFNDLAGTIASW